VSRRAGRQLLCVSLGLAGWSAFGRPDLLSLLVAYLAALLVWEMPWLRRSLAALRTQQVLLVALALSVPALAWGYRVRARIADREGLVGWTARLSDRLRLESTPSIAPPLISADRPQVFFVQAPGAERVEVQFGPGVRALPAAPLGAGLFRVQYDPRRDGAPRPGDGNLVAGITLDGRRFERELRAVTPLVHPRWFCVSPDAALAATVSEETDELIVIGPGRSLRRLPVGDGPVDCAFLDDVTVAVSQRFDGRLSLLDLGQGRAPRTLALGPQLGRLALSPERTRLVVARDGPEPELVVIGWPELDVRAHLRLTAAADLLAFGPDRDTLLVSSRADASVRRFERSGDTYQQRARLQLGRPAVSLARARDGSRVWIATTDFRPDASAQLGNHFVQDQVLTLRVADLSVIEQRLTARRSPRQSKAGDVDQGGSPLGMRELRDGRLAIAFAGTDELWRVAGSARIDQLDLGASGLSTPHDVAELADGTLLVSSPVAGAIGWLAPNAAPELLRLAPDDAALLKRNPAALARRLGERDFYESTRAGISCQSCHSHADSDQASYNLGDHRLVPTLTVRGLLGTAPYLRDGSYPRIRDLHEVALGRYRGYLRDQAGRRQTLEAFVESLPRATSFAQESRDTATWRHGYAAFRKAHCERCHAPPAFTNLAQLPMLALFPAAAASRATGEMLDVPSLLSISASAPYLNDGRARTLREVIGARNERNLHGDVRALSESEQRELLGFLSCL
jgi:hypothetical protein